MCLSLRAEGEPAYPLYGQRAVIPAPPRTGRAVRANSEGVRELPRLSPAVPVEMETCRPVRMAAGAGQEAAPVQSGLGRALVEPPEPGRLVAERPKLPRRGGTP